MPGDRVRRQSFDARVKRVKQASKPLWDAGLQALKETTDIRLDSMTIAIRHRFNDFSPTTLFQAFELRLTKKLV